MIRTIEVWVFRVMIRDPWGSSSSSPSSGREPSSGAWCAVLVRLWIFDIVNISWILGLCSPGHFSIALPVFVSFGYSLAMIIIRQDVFLQFMKKFLNRLGFLSSQMRSFGPGVRPLINALIVVLSPASGIWDLCCMNFLTKFRRGSLSFCLQLYKSNDSAVVSWNI
jgi:hypothetical protein